MKKMFISYRRAEAEYAAGALARELREHFGEEQVFRDKEDIGGGVAWKQEIVNEINPEAAMLVLIGKEWLGAKNAQGQRRLDTADDPIRMELAGGLARGARVIPVLLENAVMPGEADLPQDLRGLTQYNALPLRDSDWQYDMAKILKTLEKAGFAVTHHQRAADASVPAGQSERRGADIKWSGKLIAGGVLVTIVLLAVGGESLDHEGHLGAAIIAVVALVLGILGWRDANKGLVKNRAVGITIITLSALGLLAALGGLMPSQTGAPATPASTTAAQPPAAAPLVQEAPPAVVVAPSTAKLAVEVERKPATTVPNIAGRWTDSDDGTAIVFAQEGSRIHMIATLQGIAVEGNGALTGRNLQMTLAMASVPLGHMNLTLSPDGRALNGNMVTQGQPERIQFVR